MPTLKRNNWDAPQAAPVPDLPEVEIAGADVTGLASELGFQSEELQSTDLQQAEELKLGELQEQAEGRAAADMDPEAARDAAQKQAGKAPAAPTAFRDAIAAQKLQRGREIAREAQQGLSRADRLRGALGEPLPPIRQRPRRMGRDATIIMDGDGKRAGTPGYHHVFVPKINGNGDAGMSTIHAKASEGYEPVRFRAGTQAGKLVTNQFGLLMEASPEVAAEIWAEKHPTHGLSAEDYMRGQLAELESAAARQSRGNVGVRVERAGSVDNTIHP